METIFDFLLKTQRRAAYALSVSIALIIVLLTIVISLYRVLYMKQPRIELMMSAPISYPDNPADHANTDDPFIYYGAEHGTK